MQPIKTVLIEDQQFAAILLEHMLQHMAELKFAPIHRTTLAEGLVEIHDGIDLVITDLTLPNGKGLDTLRAVVAKTKPLAIGVVVVTGDASKTTFEEGSKLADGFLLKGKYNETDLSMSILHAIEKKRHDANLAAFKKKLEGEKRLVMSGFSSQETKN